MKGLYLAQEDLQAQMNFNTAETGAVSGIGKYTFWKANEQEEHQVDIKGKYQCVRSL